MVLTNPTAILAEGAFHQANTSAPAFHISPGFAAFDPAALDFSTKAGLVLDWRSTDRTKSAPLTFSI
jgi:hypothetical protein